MKTNFTNLHNGVLFKIDSGSIYRKSNSYSAIKVGYIGEDRRAWGFEQVTPIYDTPVTFQDEEYTQYDRYKECTWYVNKFGLFHNETGPAVTEMIRNKIIKTWYINGKRHRKGNPAVMESNGNVEWWQNGELHREDGPAVETFYDGFWSNRLWYQNGERHRLDGPAVENSEGDREYYINGKRHRLSGPAIEVDGEMRYFVNDIEYSEGLEYLVAVEEYKQFCNG